jgi:hypothetical protein
VFPNFWQGECSGGARRRAWKRSGLRRTLNATVSKVDNLVWLPSARKRENWSRGPTVDDFCAGTHGCPPKIGDPRLTHRGPRVDLRPREAARQGDGDQQPRVAATCGCLSRRDLSTGRAFRVAPCQQGTLPLAMHIPACMLAPTLSPALTSCPSVCRQHTGNTRARGRSSAAEGQAGQVVVIVRL